MGLHDLVGHDELRRSLVRAHAAGVLPQSLLLHGARGVGKQRLALWLGQLLVCAAPTDEGPCEACGPCRMTRSLEHPDVHWYFPLARPKSASRDKMAEALETARLRALDEVREEPVRASWTNEVQGIYVGAIAGLRRHAARRPTMAEGPVFIIGQAESMVPQESSQEAANALLKLLEEPPGSTHFILTSSEPGRLLPTIISRTVPLHVPPLPTDTVRTFLDGHRDLDEKTAAWAAGLGRGSPGRALDFLPVKNARSGEMEPSDLEELRRKALRIVTASIRPGSGAGYAVAMSFPPAGARGLLDLFTFVEEWLRDLAVVTSGADDVIINADATERLRKEALGNGVLPARVPDAFPAVEYARVLARGNVNPQLVVNGLVRDLRRALLAPSPVPTGATR